MKIETTKQITFQLNETERKTIDEARKVINKCGAAALQDFPETTQRFVDALSLFDLLYTCKPFNESGEITK